MYRFECRNFNNLREGVLVDVEELEEGLKLLLNHDILHLASANVGFTNQIK